MAPPPITTVRARTLFAPLDAGGRAETVARRLIDAIGLGLLLDGERLPTEASSPGSSGSRPGRCATASRRCGRWASSRRAAGAAADRSSARRDEPHRLELPLRHRSLHELRDIGDHRAAIAGAAARLAAERALAGEVATLREHLERLRGADALTDRRRADARIHIEIAATAQSPRLTREEMDLWSAVGDLVWLPVAGAASPP